MKVQMEREVRDKTDLRSAKILRGMQVSAKPMKNFYNRFICLKSPFILNFAMRELVFATGLFVLRV